MSAMNLAEPQEHAKASVLLVDDDELVRDALTLLLEQRGFDIQACSDAVQALQRLRAGHKPDLILLDLMMPGMDGWQFRVVQKTNEHWADIPVVALSGDSSAKAAAIDAEAFLAKPVCDTELLATIERLTNSLQRRRATQRETELERLQEIGEIAASVAEQAGRPLAFGLENLELAQRKARDLEARLGPSEKFSLVGVRQLLARAERGIERAQSVLNSVALFAEMAAHNAARPRRVLIAHSEPRLCAMMREALGGDFDVSCVHSGDRALSLLSEEASFDVILCELTLPSVGGIELYERLVLSKPEQVKRMVFLTSNTFGEREKAFFATHHPLQLRSPFRAADVRDVVESQWRALN